MISKQCFTKLKTHRLHRIFHRSTCQVLRAWLNFFVKNTSQYIYGSSGVISDSRKHFIWFTTIMYKKSKSQPLNIHTLKYAQEQNTAIKPLGPVWVLTWMYVWVYIWMSLLEHSVRRQSWSQFLSNRSLIQQTVASCLYPRINQFCSFRSRYKDWLFDCPKIFLTLCVTVLITRSRRHILSDDRQWDEADISSLPACWYICAYFVV